MSEPASVLNNFRIPLPTRRRQAGANLEKFKKAIEEYIGRPLTDGDIDRGIASADRNRRLLRKAYEYRKLDNPPLTGEEINRAGDTGSYQRSPQGGEKISRPRKGKRG